MVGVGRPTDAQLTARLAVASRADLSYDHVGSTLEPDDRSGRSPHRVAVAVGAGDEVFDRARVGLRKWVCHRGIGATVHPADAALDVGSTLLVVLHAGPVSVIVPNRVVAVVDETDRFGFAYGTLDGHQERGEESFLVERATDGRVNANVTVDAGAATLAARVASLIVSRFQHVAARRYLEAWREFVESSPTSP
jgi:uncharacterized protein (UPF0548 family)